MAELTGIDCVGYIRVSTDKQAGEVQTSPEDQRRAIEALATKLGRTVGAWFRDEGFSGATYEKRPALRALVTACEAAPRRDGSGLVLALNDSRWGRFPDVEEATYWRVYLRRVGWVVRFAENDDVQDKLLRPILRAMSQGQATHYRDTVRENARRGARGTAEQGFWTTREPFGFRRAVVYPPGRERELAPGTRKAADEKIKLVPYEPEARIVRAIFERYANGLESGWSLVRWLRAAYPEHRWSKPGVMHLLRNPAYVGDVQLGRRLHAGDGKPREGTWRRPESEWFGKRDAHTAIIDRALFAAAQQRIARNAKQARVQPGRYILSGLLTCEHCGAPMIGGGIGTPLASGEVQRFYRCGSLERGIRCPGKLGCVSKPRLEGAVLDTITQYLTRPGAMREIARAIDAAWKRPAGDAATDRRTLTRELRTLEQQRDRLVASIARGTLTDADAAPQMRQLRSRITAATEALQAAGAAARRPALAEEQRQAMLRMAAEFPKVAERLAGPELRALIAPWLAGGTFNKENRVLTLHLRPLPASFGMAGWPEPTEQPQTRHVTRRVALTEGRRGWVALGGSR